MSIVTLTTDFGLDSAYVAQMKGAMLSIAPELAVIDVTHLVPRHDIRQGAWVLQALYGRFPAGTVHVAVVDPGVGTSRPILAARMGTSWWIAPDNGLLSWVARRAGPTSFVRLTNTRYWAGDVAPTFHGRDIMGPAAVHLSRLQNLDDFGERTGQQVRLPWPEVRQSGDTWLAEVMLIDSFGTAITNVTSESLMAAASATLHIRCGEHTIVGLCQTYGERPRHTPLALMGSDGFLELAVAEGSAHRELGLGVGDKIELWWT